MDVISRALLFGGKALITAIDMTQAYQLLAAPRHRRDEYSAALNAESVIKLGAQLERRGHLSRIRGRLYS